MILSTAPLGLPWWVWLGQGAAGLVVSEAIARAGGGELLEALGAFIVGGVISLIYLRQVAARHARELRRDLEQERARLAAELPRIALALARARRDRLRGQRVEIN